MNDEARKNLVKGTIEAINSLRTTIQNAGGDGESLTDIETMEEMTVLDFMSNVAAPNGIRFHYEDKKYEDEEEENLVPNKTTCCPSCGCKTYSPSFKTNKKAKTLNSKICTDCGKEWFSYINYDKKCKHCRKRMVDFNSLCHNCGWQNINKTKNHHTMIYPGTE